MAYNEIANLIGLFKSGPDNINQIKAVKAPQNIN